MSLKSERIASDMQREISSIILFESKDKDFKDVTITHVDVTNDLSFAKVYFTTMNEDKKFIENDLNNAASYFRRNLSQKLDIRHTPEIKFIYDESIEYGQKIEKIIEQINNK